MAMEMDEPSGPTDIHEPFTVPEHIAQLGEIDKQISQLMRYTGTALGSLATPSSSSSSSSPPATEPSSEADAKPRSLTVDMAQFQTSMNGLLQTLQNVDVLLKRQIYSLEEAGIISLGNSSSGGDTATSGNDAPSSSTSAPFRNATGAGAASGGSIGNSASGNNYTAKATLQPTGLGLVGNLDVGWLNSRSGKVERDMDAELWQQAREYLEKVVVKDP